jgi:hypothetical protein
MVETTVIPRVTHVVTLADGVRPATSPLALPVSHTPVVQIYRSTILRTASIPVSRRIPGVAMTGATVAVVPVVEDFITV